MIVELAKRVMGFPGQANRTCCLAHIINLVAKRLLKQFDVLKNNAGPALSTTQQELEELAEELETEGGGKGDGDNLEGFIDETEGMTEGELHDFKKSVQPVQLVLVKVRKVWQSYLIHLLNQMLRSCGSSHSKLYTLLLSSYQPGTQLSRTSSCLYASCPTMSPHGGTSLLTCSSLRWIIKRRFVQSVGILIWA